MNFLKKIFGRLAVSEAEPKPPVLDQQDIDEVVGNIRDEEAWADAKALVEQEVGVGNATDMMIEAKAKEIEKIRTNLAQH